MIILLALILASALTLVGALDARKTKRSDVLIGIYVAFTLLAQVIAAKIAIFDFGLFQVTAPAASVIFAVTFLVTDIVNEKFGRKEVNRMILIAFYAQLAMVAFLYIATSLPPAPFWGNEREWAVILGLVPRITFASWITFLISEGLDAYLFDVVRRRTGPKHLWARNLFSTVPAIFIDTVVFVFLAFAGSDLPLWPMMLGQFTTKYVVAVIDVPFVYANRAVLGPRLSTADNGGTSE